MPGSKTKGVTDFFFFTADRSNNNNIIVALVFEIFCSQTCTKEHMFIICIFMVIFTFVWFQHKFKIYLYAM